LQRLRFGPDVAAAYADRGENRDPGKQKTEVKKVIDKGGAIRERPPGFKSFAENSDGRLIAIMCSASVDAAH
jgi:hypothetical protein